MASASGGDKMMKRIEGNACKWEARHRTIVRASCFAALVLFVLLAPTVSALSTLPPGTARTQIYSNGACDAAVVVPVPQDITHTSGDGVYVRMWAWWDDYRSPGSSEYDNYYKIDANYRGTHYRAEYMKSTYGNEHSSAWYEFGTTVPNVQTGYSMTVTYIVYVNIAFTCYDEGTTTFTFVP